MPGIVPFSPGSSDRTPSNAGILIYRCSPSYDHSIRNEYEKWEYENGI